MKTIIKKSTITDLQNRIRNISTKILGCGCSYSEPLKDGRHFKWIFAGKDIRTSKTLALNVIWLKCVVMKLHPKARIRIGSMNQYNGYGTFLDIRCYDGHKKNRLRFLKYFV